MALSSSRPATLVAPSTARVIGIVVLGALGIGFSAIFVRLALPAPPVVTAFYRMLFALPLLAVLVARSTAAAPVTPRSVALAVGAGAFLGADLAIWHLAIARTSVANATLLINTTPIYVGLWAAWVLHERPGWRFVGAVALALLGTRVLIGVDQGSEIHLEGDALALVAALFYSGYLIAMKRVRREVDALPALLAATCGGVAVTGIFAALRGDPFVGFPDSSWAAFVGAAVISHVGGVLGIAWGLRWLRATFASLALLVQPIGTTLLGWWILAEPLGAHQAFGAALVLLGILLASRSALDPDAGVGPPAAAPVASSTHSG